MLLTDETAPLYTLYVLPFRWNMGWFNFVKGDSFPKEVRDCRVNPIFLFEPVSAMVIFGILSRTFEI